MSPVLEVFIKLMIVVVFIALLASIFYFLNASLKKSVKEAMASAQSKGLAVGEAVIPYWDSYWAKKARGSSGKCTEYSLKHVFPKATHWAFLQREEISGNEFPYGWTFVLEEGQVSDRLKVALMKIAKEWTEEYLEFVNMPEKVSAYCLSGGTKLADKLYSYLKELSAVTD